MTAHTDIEATPASLIHPAADILAAVGKVRSAVDELRFQAWKTGRAGLNERPIEDAAVAALDAALESLQTLALGKEKIR